MTILKTNTPCQCPFDAGYGIHLFALQRLCGRGVTGGYSTIELSNHNFPDILNVKVVPSLPTLRPLQTWQTRIPPRQPSGAWSKG